MEHQAAFRQARASDLPAIVAMLADDALGAARERVSDPLPESYATAFAHIDADPNNELIVAERDGIVVAMMQLTYIPSLSYQGSWRALIESVRVHGSMRGRGLGHALIHHAVERARARGCGMVQLTTHKSRTDAHRFYQDLGFVASHEGMKRMLDTPARAQDV
ncbi:MAG TPA: GNAT family N-acetyltransferase [Noviherbaspirillum sp.]|nr:GNAT family N-acetyltransferase [Noviherbaspirillum sp.]